MWTHIQALVVVVRARIRMLREDPEAGYSTEVVVGTALLAALALTVLIILTAKVIAKVKGIDL